MLIKEDIVIVMQVKTLGILNRVSRACILFLERIHVSGWRPWTTFGLNGNPARFLSLLIVHDRITRPHLSSWLLLLER